MEGSWGVFFFVFLDKLMRRECTDVRFLFKKKESLSYLKACVYTMALVWWSLSTANAWVGVWRVSQSPDWGFGYKHTLSLVLYHPVVVQVILGFRDPTMTNVIRVRWLWLFEINTVLPLARSSLWLLEKQSLHSTRSKTVCWALSLVLQSSFSPW